MKENNSLALPALLRQAQIIGNADRRRRQQKAGKPESQAIEPLIPVSSSAWWDGIKAGRYPKPIKLSPKVTVWRAEDIRALLSKLGNAK